MSTLAQQSDPGFGRFRNTALSSADVAIKPSAANIFGLILINVNETPVYVKFYNSNVGNTVVGTTVPQYVIMVPAGDGTTPGCVYAAPGDVSLQYFQLALSVAAVTGLSDDSTVAPDTAIYAEVLYK